MEKIKLLDLKGAKKITVDIGRMQIDMTFFNKLKFLFGLGNSASKVELFDVENGTMEVLK